MLCGDDGKNVKSNRKLRLVLSLSSVTLGNNTEFSKGGKLHLNDVEISEPVSGWETSIYCGKLF